MTHAMCAGVSAFMLVACAPSSPDACTLWAAAGGRVAAGGTLIAKNRDKKPEEENTLELVIPGKGYRYVGLLAYRPRSESGGTKAGINEKGLVVVSATAGSVSAREREGTRKFGNRKMLSACDSVDTVLAHRDSFSNDPPGFYMLADSRKIAVVEIAPAGRVSIEVNDNGVLCHTNHYTGGTLAGANRKIGASSRTRLERIVKLLVSHNNLLTVGDFITFSSDRNAGPDNSIWRTGSRPAGTRTLASWIARVPPEGAPELYVKTANAGETEKVYRLTLDSHFWTDARKGTITGSRGNILKRLLNR